MSASSRFQAVAVSAGSYTHGKAIESWKGCRLISKMVVCTKPAETNWVAGLQDSDRHDCTWQSMCSTAVRDVACSSLGRSLLPSQAVASRPLEGGFEWLEVMKSKGEAYAKGHGTAFIGACGRLMIGCMAARPMRRRTTRWEWALAGLNATQPLSQPCQRYVAGRSAEGSGAG